MTIHFTDMTHDIADNTTASNDGCSATASAFAAMALYGQRLGTDEPDPRPLPEAARAEASLRQITDGIVGLVAGSRLEDDAEDLLWSVANLFHRKISRIERDLDRNEANQRQLHREFDGSEVKDVELQRAHMEGTYLEEQLVFYEGLRDLAADRFLAETGLVWMPPTGSRTNTTIQTAAVIDSRDFLAARRRQRDQALAPEGPGVVFAGGTDCQDVDAIWSVLDRVFKKHPGMVLMHGGNRKGADLIAAKWAATRKIPQVVFQPDWALGKAAPFKRNDRMLAENPIGLIIFPGNGIIENLADKARQKGVPVIQGGA